MSDSRGKKRKQMHLSAPERRDERSQPIHPAGNLDGQSGNTSPVLSGGKSLESNTRSQFEPKFGHDFGRVRVHADARAADLAEQEGAAAFTVGRDVVFGAGRYEPNTPRGSRLIAHELAHVVQQDRGARGGAAPTNAEDEARQAASLAMSGKATDIQGEAPVGIQRQPATTEEAEATEDTTAQIPELWEEVTPYGTFLIYPDDFIGPLQVADPTIGPWPVREAQFNRLQYAIDSIGGGGAGITIEGDVSFKTTVLMDFAWLMTQPLGMELVDEIVASGHDLTIESTSGGNAMTFTTDGYELADGSPGPGSDASVEYNTEEWNPYGGPEDWMQRPPAIGLAHELIHAWTAMAGICAKGTDADSGVNRRELQATGLDEFESFRITENRFRAAFGLPARPEY